MNLEFGMPWQELALRFTAFTWGVDSCIVGTTSLDHLQQNIESINKGKLTQSMIDELRTAFHRHQGHIVCPPAETGRERRYASVSFI